VLPVWSLHLPCRLGFEQCCVSGFLEAVQVVFKSLRPVGAIGPPEWSRQCDSVENFADKKVSLNSSELLSYDPIVEPQMKQASRVAWDFKLNDDPLDWDPAAHSHASVAPRPRRRNSTAAMASRPAVPVHVIKLDMLTEGKQGGEVSPSLF
jgi:hypothetical protein